MAKREEYRLDVETTDNASGKLDQIADAQGKIKETTKITADVDDQASDDLDKVAQAATDLDGKSATVTADAKDDASSKITDVDTAVEDLDGKTATATVDAEQGPGFDSTAGTLAALDGETVSATVDAAEGVGLTGTKGDLDAIDGGTYKATVDANEGAGLTGAQGDLKEIDGHTYKATVDAKPGQGLESMFGNIAAMPGRIGSIGAQAASLGVGKGAVAVLAGLFAGAAVSTANMALDVQNLSTLTGEDFSYVDKFTQLINAMSGLSTGDLLEIIAQTNQTLQQSPELERLLGISKEEFAAHPLQGIVDIISTLQGMAADERLTTMFKIFGEEGAKQLAPLIASGQDLTEILKNMPSLVTPQDAAEARQIKQDFAELVVSLKSIGSDIGEPLLRILQPLAAIGAEGAGLLAGALDPLADLLSGEQLSTADISDEMFQFLELVQSGIPRWEAWKTAISSTGAGFDEFRSQVILANQFIAEGMTLNEAMGEAFGVTGDAAITFARIVGVDLPPSLAETEQAERDAAKAAEEHTDALEPLNEGLHETRDALSDAADAANDLGDSFDAVLGPGLDLAEAQEDLIQNNVDLTKAIHENGKSLSANSDAGRKNREQIRDNIQGALDYAEAMIENGRSASEAEAFLNNYREELREQLLQLGLNEGAVDAYLTELGFTPENITTAIELTGLDAADEVITRHNENLDKIPPYVSSQVQVLVDKGLVDEANALLDAYLTDPYVRVHVNLPGLPRIVDLGGGQVGYDFSHGTGPIAVQHGITYAPEGWAWVGEAGPELRRLRAGDQVVDHARSMEMAANAGRGGGAGLVVNETIHMPPGTPTSTMQRWRRYNRRNGFEPVGVS